MKEHYQQFDSTAQRAGVIGPGDTDRMAWRVGTVYLSVLILVVVSFAPSGMNAQISRYNPCTGGTSTAALSNGVSATCSITGGSAIEYDWISPVGLSSNSLATINVKVGGVTQFSVVPTIHVAVSGDWLVPASATINNTAKTMTVEFLDGKSNIPVYITINPGFDGNIVTTQVVQVNPINTTVPIQSVELGQWPTSPAGREIAVPYYDHTIHYFDSLALFVNAYWDTINPYNPSHTQPSPTNPTQPITNFAASQFNSHATIMINDSQTQVSEAEYLPLTNTAYNTLNETMDMVVSSVVGQVFPYLHNAVSPYIQQLAGSFVIEIPTETTPPTYIVKPTASSPGTWASGAFTDLQAKLSNLREHGLGAWGLGNCATIIHNWQDFGRDNAYPDAYDTTTAGTGYLGNVELAGSTGVNGISSGAGCYAALHENFNDYYPNYPNYTKSSVALNADSSTAEGWTNSGTGVQAQVAKTTKFMSNATTQSPNVHSNLTTTATYLDVDSANPPWSQTSTGLSQGVDMDSTAANAGMFSSYISGSAALWQYERNTHAGPVFGEGKNHWFYSGLLDGVEAQVGGTGAPDTLPGMLGPQIPLFVDFDLTVIHPLQVNHGMGNFENWSNPGVSGISVEDTAAADAYRMEEIIFGHAPSMSEPYANSYLWSVVPRALQEQMLVSPVAARYGVSTVSQIQYMVNGTWSGSSSAAKTNDFTRPQVTYSDGDTIIANAQSGILTVDGVDLPQYGWMAQGPGLLAYTALVGGVVADYAETQANSAINPATATSYFANARNANDLATLDCAFIGCDSSMPALAEMNSIVYNSAGTFTMNWTALQNFDSTQAYTLTINLSSPSYTTLTAIAALSIRTGGYPGTNPLEGLVLQGTTNAVTGLVKGVAYTVTATLCTSNACQPLYGVETNTPYTYTMGTLTVTGTPPTSSFTQTIPAIALDNYLNMSGSMLNFGAIQTDGMVSLQWNTHYKSNNWLISAWPRFARGSGNSTPNIEIADAAIPMPVSIECHIKVPGNSDYLTTVTPIPVQNGTYWKVNLTAGAKYCFFTGSDDTVGNSVTATLSQPNPFTPTNLTKTVTLTNSSTSTSSLTIGSIAVSGTGTSYFSVPASPCGTSPLAIGGTCNFTVTFTPPTGSGSTVANLVVTDNAGNTPQTSVLSGTWGSWAGLSLSPDTIFFDDVIDGSSGTPQTITLTNNGTAALTGLTFALTATPITSPATPLTFAITSNSCGTSLNPGQCTLQVNFTPTAWKASSAILTVIGTNPASSTPVSATITLSGTGLPPT